MLLHLICTKFYLHFPKKKSNVAMLLFLICIWRLSKSKLQSMIEIRQEKCSIHYTVFVYVCVIYNNFHILLYRGEIDFVLGGYSHFKIIASNNGWGVLDSYWVVNNCLLHLSMCIISFDLPRIIVYMTWFPATSDHSCCVHCICNAANWLSL